MISVVHIVSAGCYTFQILSGLVHARPSIC